MPLVGPPLGDSQVFWNTEDVLNFARVLCDDAQGGLAGEILADTQPYTWVLLNLVYAKLANWLEDSNVESATYAEARISLPAGPCTDPNAQASLDYTGYTDAAGFWVESPTLPGDLVEPLQLWQCPTGTNQPFMEMRQQLGGLTPGYDGGFLGRWEFRQNAIYFAGGPMMPTDLRIRYIPSFPVLVKPTGDQPAPTLYFARTGEALAYMLAAEYQEIRNASNAAILRKKADEQLEIIGNKAAKRANRTQTRMRGYGFGGRRGGGTFKVYG